MLTLLAILSGSGATKIFLKILFDSQLVVLELALVAGISGLIRRRESQKRTLSLVSEVLLIAGTILLSRGAALPI